MNDSLDRKFAFTSIDLLVGVALFAIVLASLLTFGPLIAAAVSVVVSLALIFLGHHYRRLLARVAGRILIFPALAALGLTLFVTLMFGIGPVYSSAKWPAAVQRIANLAGAGTRGTRVSCLGDFIDEEYVWCQRVPNDRLDEVLATYDWKPLAMADAPTWFAARFPFWWRPDVTPHCQFYAAGDAATQWHDDFDQTYVAMHDPEEEWLYVWYHYRF